MSTLKLKFLLFAVKKKETFENDRVPGMNCTEKKRQLFPLAKAIKRSYAFKRTFCALTEADIFYKRCDLGSYGFSCLGDL